MYVGYVCLRNLYLTNTRNACIMKVRQGNAIVVEEVGMAIEAMNEIKIIRKEAGMTQKMFSDFFGIPVRTLQDWEAGLRKPPGYVVRLLPYKLKAEWDYENKRPKTLGSMQRPSSVGILTRQQ